MIGRALFKCLKLARQFRCNGALKFRYFQAQFSLWAVSYTHLDVYKRQLKSYDSIYIAPTIIDKKVIDKIGDARIDLVANLIDRTICMNLAKSYEILGSKSDNALSMKLYLSLIHI